MCWLTLIGTIYTTARHTLLFSRFLFSAFLSSFYLFILLLPSHFFPLFYSIFSFSSYFYFSFSLSSVIQRTSLPESGTHSHVRYSANMTENTCINAIKQIAAVIAPLSHVDVRTLTVWQCSRGVGALDTIVCVPTRWCTATEYAVTSCLE